METAYAEVSHKQKAVADAENAKAAAFFVETAKQLFNYEQTAKRIEKIRFTEKIFGKRSDCAAERFCRKIFTIVKIYFAVSTPCKSGFDGIVR